MNKHIVSTMALSWLLLLALYTPMAFAATPPNTLVIHTIGMPETVDPSWCYDTASAELIFNVYEPLIQYKVDRTLDPKEQGRVDEFVPGLATEWTIEEISEVSPHGVPWSYRFTFKIRCPANGDPPVYFHNGEVLEPEDVEYSIERIMVQDRSGGPEWMWYAPLLGRSHAPKFNTTALVNFIYKIDEAVESNSTHVWFNFKGLLGPPESQLQIAAQSWGSIFNKDWCTAYVEDWHGNYEECLIFRGDTDWNGLINVVDSSFVGLHWAPLPYDVNADFNRDGIINVVDSSNMGLNWGIYPDHKGWYRYHDPPKSPLDDPASGGPRMCGTGPYKLDYVDYLAKKWHIVKYDNYWQGWPSPLNSPSGTYQGYLNDVLHVVIDDWPTRREAFLACDSDFCYVPREYIGQVEGQPNIECIWPMEVLACDGIFYNLDIPDNTLYAGGPGGHGYPYDEFHIDGIPRNFFSDIHIRRAFSYTFNYTEYIEDVYLGEAVHPSTPMVVGLGPKEPVNIPVLLRDGGTLPNGTYLPPIDIWPNDLGKAVEEFKLAFGGSLTPGSEGPAWTTGFTLTITYNTGSIGRLRVCEMLKYYIEMIHPRATILIQEVDWDTYLDDLVNWPLYKARMTIFLIGWLADYPDVHNFIFPYFHTDGDFTYFQSYSNSTVDDLIMAAISPEALADPNLRTGYYWTLGTMWREEMPTLITIQGLGRHWQKTWVEGWYYNPIYPGDYFYHIWKEMP